MISIGFARTLQVPHCLYLIGIPGSGKTTLLRTTLLGVPAQMVRVGLLTYLRYPGGIELGYRRPLFGGTDTLPMNVQPFALSWLESACPARALVAEGDRLANDAFFTALLGLGWQLTLAWLDCPPEVAAARRQQRGSKQQERWIKGRETKVAGLVKRWGPHLWRLDALAQVEVLADQLHAHPVCQALIHPKEVRHANPTAS